MREWINFYTHIDKGLNGGLTKFLVVFAIPTLISIIILLFGYNLMNLFSSTPIDMEARVWWEWIIVLAINWLILVLGAVATLIAGTLAFAIFAATFNFIKAKFQGIKSFVTLVKTAKEKSFDNSNVKFDNTKQEMKIKG